MLARLPYTQKPSYLTVVEIGIIKKDVPDPHPSRFRYWRTKMSLQSASSLASQLVLQQHSANHHTDVDYLRDGVAWGW